MFASTTGIENDSGILAAPRLKAGQKMCVVMSIWMGDSALLLKDSLESVSNQSEVPDQVIVVIDGPIKELCNRHLVEFARSCPAVVRVIRLPENLGLWNARNVGISASTQEFIAFHDADDVMHPKRLEYQLRTMKEQQLDVLGSAAIEVDSVSRRVVGVRSFSIKQRCGKIVFGVVNPVNHSSVIVRRESILRVGSYRAVPGVEDLDLWRRLCDAHARISVSQTVLQALFTSQELLARRRISSQILSSEATLFRWSLVSGNLGNNVKALTIFTTRVLYRILPRWLMSLANTTLLRKRVQLPFGTLAEFVAKPPFSLN